MAKHMRRGGAVRRFKELQANLMANSAAAVAGMTGEMQQEAGDQEMAGWCLLCRSMLQEWSQSERGPRTQCTTVQVIRNDTTGQALV